MSYIPNDGENSGRMPLLLPFDMAKDFVQKDLSPERYKRAAEIEMPSEELNYHPVFTICSPKARLDEK